MSISRKVREFTAKHGKAALMFVLGALCASVLATYWYRDHSANRSYSIREKNGDYEFINPLLFYETPEEHDSAAYRGLETELEAFIAKAKAEAGVEDASVYFRGGGSTRWIGINEDDAYRPKSLLKVPFMLMYLKKAEGEPGLLDKQLSYSQAIKAKYDADPLENNSTLVPGKEYSVSTLIRRMVMESDNVAKDILLSGMDQADMEEIFKDLGIKVPHDNEPDYSISPKFYASFFRILYNSTYLNRESSEWALSLLTETQFDKGLRAPIPKEIPIAHKFGIEAATLEGEDLQLHDCGIIYHPDMPYMLCVMTRGRNVANLGNTIAGISKIVYGRIGDLVGEK